MLAKCRGWRSTYRVPPSKKIITFFMFGFYRGPRYIAVRHHCDTMSATCQRIFMRPGCLAWIYFATSRVKTVLWHADVKWNAATSYSVTSTQRHQLSATFILAAWAYCVFLMWLQCHHRPCCALRKLGQPFTVNQLPFLCHLRISWGSKRLNPSDVN